MKAFIKLTGSANRYNLDGQIYDRGKVYSVPQSRAEILVRKKDNFRRPYFSLLTEDQVEELTGVRPEAPKPPKPPEAELVNSDETDAEAEAAVQAEKEAEEAAELDSEPDITDEDTEVFGGEPEVEPDELVEDSDDDQDEFSEI